MDPAAQRDVSLDLIREVIARGDEVPLQASGLSMGHSIRSGEWILVRRVDPEQVRPGDIVLHQCHATFVAHRVIRRWRQDGGWRFLTKGDGHFSADAPIRGTDLVARVVGVRRGDRVLRLDGWRGRWAARLLLGHSLALWYLWRLWRARRRARPPGHARPLTRGLLLFPQKLIVRVWNRLAKRTPG